MDIQLTISVRNHSERVAVLVDVQSLFYAAKNVQQSKVEYGRFLAGVVGNRVLTRAIAYVVQRDQISAGFCDALTRFGYDIRLKNLPARVEGENQARWSWVAGICVDALRIAPKVDTLILASGDSQLVPLVEALTGLGLRVEIAGVERGTAGDLIREASSFQPIRSEWMFKEPKFTNTEPVARRTSGYEGLPDDDELEVEAAALAARQRGIQN